MRIKEWYKDMMEDDVVYLEKKYVILSAVSLTGILAAMKKNDTIHRLAFIVMDSLLIIDTLVELIISLNKQERKGKK